MSNVTIKRVSELLSSVLKILWNKPDGLTAKEVLLLIPQTIQLNDYELSFSTKTNLPRYERIVRLATVPLVHAGWLIKSERGRWYITEYGQQAVRSFNNVQDFYKEAFRLYGIQKQEIPESAMVIEIAQESSWGQVEKYILQSHHTKLQAMLAELLRAMDYYPSWIAPPEKKRGQIDLIAYVDPIGVKGKRVIAQVKHKGQAVTLEGVKGFFSSLGTDDFGVIFSTGGFTNEAIQELASGNFQRITALDTGAFFDFWKQFYGQLSQEARQLLPLKPVYFLSRDA